MKKINKITAVFSATATLFSMTAAMNFTATAAETTYLKDQSKKFLVKNEVFEKKYNDAKTRLDNNSYLFDYKNSAFKADDNGEIIVDERKIDYEDYQIIRDEINALYKEGKFSYGNFNYHDANFQLEDVNITIDKNVYTFAGYSLRNNSRYEFARYDVDGDSYLSFYDYCCLLKYIQDKYEIKYDCSGDYYKGEIGAMLTSFKSDDKFITSPTEVYYNGHIIPILYIAPYAFSDCKNVETLTINNYTQPAWFKKIEHYDDTLFNNQFQMLDNIGETPASIYVDIYFWAFYGCDKLETINFPKNVNFSVDTFEGTPFADSEENIYPSKGIVYAKSSDGNAIAACGVYDLNLALNYRNNMYNFDIADNTTTITNNLKGAFGCMDSNVDYSLTLPSEIKYIHNDAFVNCKNLKWINGKNLEDFSETNASEKKIKEFIKRNNAAFQSTKFINNAAQKVIDDVVNDITSNYSDKKAQFNEACKYIFKKADYRNFDYIDDGYLFANGDYNTIDENRDNVYAAANTFLSDYTECESYAMALSLLLDQLNIKNYVIGGGGHALNVVYLNNKWYRVDMSIYSDYNRDYDFYLRKCNEEKKSSSFLLEDSPVGYGISGTSKLSGFEHTKQIVTNCVYYISNLADDRSSLTLVLPDESVLPVEIRNELAAGRFKALEHERGWFSIGDDYFFFKENNVLAYNEEVTISYDGADRIYRFDYNGLMHKDWYEDENHNKYFYDYGYGKLINKYAYIDGVYYHFNNEGIVDKNTNLSWSGITLHADGNGAINVEQRLSDEDLALFNSGIGYRK